MNIASKIRFIIIETRTDTRVWIHSIKRGVITNEVYDLLSEIRELKS